MQHPHSFAHKRWRWPLALLALGVVALLLRWYYVSTAIVLQPLRGDATQYFAYAWNLAHHGTFAPDAVGAAVLHPDNYRDPGYPLLLAFWMILLGDGAEWYSAVLLFQAFLGALTVVMATQLGGYWLPRRWAFAAGLLMAVWPHSISINGYLLSETLFGFLTVLAAMLGSQAFRRGSSLPALLSGGVFGITALTNAVLLPFCFLLAVLLAWRKMALPKVCFALALGCIIFPAAWAIRNIHIAPASTDSSSQARALQNFEQGSRPDFQSAWRLSIMGSAGQRISAGMTLDGTDAEYHLLRNHPRLGLASIGQRFATHPLHYVEWYLFEKPQLLWGWSIEIGQGDIYVYPTTNSPFQTSRFWIVILAICHTLNQPLLLLALVSAVVALPPSKVSSTLGNRYQSASLFSILALSAFVTVVYSFLQAEPRYSTPFKPFEILLAITTLWMIANWLRAQRTRSAASPLSWPFHTSSSPNDPLEP